MSPRRYRAISIAWVYGMSPTWIFSLRYGCRISSCFLFCHAARTSFRPFSVMMIPPPSFWRKSSPQICCRFTRLSASRSAMNRPEALPSCQARGLPFPADLYGRIRRRDRDPPFQAQIRRRVREACRRTREGNSCCRGVAAGSGR